MRHKEFMTIHQRLKIARIAAGFERAVHAADALAIRRPTYSGHENGNGKFNQDSAITYARRFGVSLEWLLTGKGAMKDGSSGDEQSDLGSNFTRTKSVKSTPAKRVRGEVAAGVWREVDHDAMLAHGDVPSLLDPRFSEESQFVIIVRGTSLNKTASDGDFLLCVDLIGTGIEIRPGDMVIVERLKDEGGLVETTAKRVHRQNGVYELHPESTDPQFQKPIIIPEDGTNEFESIRIIAKVLLISKKP